MAFHFFYRFLVPSPSEELLGEIRDKWNMSVSDSIHSPCYHVSNSGSVLSIVLLEYDGIPPSHPRGASIDELRDVAERSKLDFVLFLIDFEKTSNTTCCSTLHVDCHPWYQPDAVLVGDVAHAYGPLTAKMANLAINDVHCLERMLNLSCSRKHVSQKQVLKEWQRIQRPKFILLEVLPWDHLDVFSLR